MSKLQDLTINEVADDIARYLPNNPLYESKYLDGYPLRKILLGLASQWNATRNYFNEVYDQWSPATTTQFLTEWEDFVGIPDLCLNNNGTLEERRRNILLKLGGINVETDKQIINIANILGIENIQVNNAIDLIQFPLSFPIMFIDPAQAPFTIVVTISGITNLNQFPLSFPISFSSNISLILECLLNKIKQSNTYIIFRYI